MKILQFASLSLLLINGNFYAMQDDVGQEVIQEGTIGLKPIDQQALKALNNVDLLYEIHTFRGNDGRKENLKKQLLDGFNKYPILIFSSLPLPIEKQCWCDQCSAQFYGEKGLWFHKWRNHNFCLACLMHFNTSDGYEAHCKEKHSFCEKCYMYYDVPEALETHKCLCHTQTIDPAKLSFAARNSY